MMKRKCQNRRSPYLPAPATTIFILGKSIIGLPCALTAPKRPAIATPAVPWTGLGFFYTSTRLKFDIRRTLDEF